MKKAQLHIKITFALFAVLAGAQVNATNMQVWLCVAQQQKECRLNQEKNEISVDVDKNDKELKKIPQIKAKVISFYTAGFLLSPVNFTWGQNSLTKKAARGEFSLFEEDRSLLLHMKRSFYAEKSHSLS